MPTWLGADVRVHKLLWLLQGPFAGEMGCGKVVETTSVLTEETPVEPGPVSL